jgi:N-acetylmuramoyl-L-alanine amidase
MHHTALSGFPAVTATQSQEAVRMRLIWNSHVNGNGWSDIGYHFIIMPSGRIYEGRSERLRGSHDLVNDGLGIAFDGIYTSATISTQQFQAAVALCTLLCRRYGFRDPVTPVPTPTADFGTRNLPLICGHRDRVATACPGSEGGRTIRLSEIRTATRNNLQ